MINKLTMLKRTSSVSTLILRWGQMLANAVREFLRNTGEDFWKSSNSFSEAQRALSNVEKYCDLNAERMGGNWARLLPPFGIITLRPASVNNSISAVLAWADFLCWYGLLASWSTGFFVCWRWRAEDWWTGWTLRRGGNVSSTILLASETGVTSCRNWLVKWIQRIKPSLLYFSARDCAD